MPKKGNKKSSGRGQKQNNGNLATEVMALVMPSKASSIAEPPPVTDTIRLTKRIQVTLPAPASGSEVVSPALLATGIPGGLTYWRNMRIERLDFWSNHVISETVGTDTLTVTAAGNDAWSQTVAQWVDSGTPGQRRAHVAFRLGLLNRARFFNTADNTPLAAVSYDGGASQVICQAVVELESNFIV
jgi:hypothetical protein